MPKLDPLTGLLDGQNLERRLNALLDRATIPVNQSAS
jgi:hypothetical protein